jgi:hypothetical protein
MTATKNVECLRAAASNKGTMQHLSDNETFGSYQR